MAHISKRKALKALRRNLERGRNILANGGELEGLSMWRYDTGRLLAEIFGESDDFTERFSGTNMVIPSYGDGLIEELMKSDPNYNAQGLEQNLVVIQDSIQHIIEYGLPAERTQINPLWYKLGIPGLLFLASLFTSPVQRLVGITSGSNNELTDAQREMMCKQMMVEFENQLWEFDESKTFSLDSLMGVLNGRGMLQSGPAKTFIAHFRESNQRQRDQAIDSFYLAYMLQGGDTTKLRYRR